MESAQVQRDYHHPFTPYDIQRQFMNGVYDCLETGNVGIFESPTGLAPYWNVAQDNTDDSQVL